MRGVVRLALAALATAAAGCGPAGYPVAGRVFLDGRPLTAGEVTLYPEAGGPLPGDRLPVGKVGPDGSYRVTLAGRSDRVPPGRYKAVVSALSADRPPGVPANPLGLYPLVGRRFSDRSKTPLRIDVVPAPAAGAYDLSVTR